MAVELINGRTPEEIKRVLTWANYSCGGFDCDDCPYQDVCSHENERRVVSDALALIQRLESKQPTWISVEERLPQPFVSVLVHMPGERPHPTVREGYISSEGVWVAGYFRRESDEVTHWAEMPEPPEEEYK